MKKIKFNQCTLKNRCKIANELSLDQSIVSITEYLDGLQRVILFGAGGAGRYALNHLKKRNIDVLCFCDNDSNKIDSIIDGVPVKSPDILGNYKEISVFISSDYAVEIAQQLKSIGITKYLYFGYCLDFDRWKDHFEPDLIIRSWSEIKQVFDFFCDDFSRKMFWSLVRFRLTSDPLYLIEADFNQYFHPIVKPEIGDIIMALRRFVWI